MCCGGRCAERGYDHPNQWRGGSGRGDAAGCGGRGISRADGTARREGSGVLYCGTAARSAGTAGAGQHRRDRHGDIYRPGDGGVWCAGARCERPRHDAAAAGGDGDARAGERAVGQEGRAGHTGRAARDV